MAGRLTFPLGWWWLVIAQILQRQHLCDKAYSLRQYTGCFSWGQICTPPALATCKECEHVGFENRKNTLPPHFTVEFT